MAGFPVSPALLEASRLHDLAVDGPRRKDHRELGRERLEIFFDGDADLLTACFGYVLARHTRAESVVMGVRDATGLVIAVLPSAASLADAVAAARLAIAEARGGPRELAAYLLATETPHDPSFHPIYQTGIRFDAGFVNGEMAELDLELCFSTGVLELTYRTDVVHALSAQRILNQTAALLTTGEENSEDLHALVVGANSTRQIWPEDKCIHDLFLDAASVNPHATALRYANAEGIIIAEELTYAAMAWHVASLASRLKVEPDDRVALLLERDLAMVVAVYAVLLAGGCYVPLEPDYPAERIKTVVEDASAKLILTQEHLLESVSALCLGWYEGEILCCDLQILEQPFTDLKKMRQPAKPSNLVYVFYTSGTTGKPKGVMVEHRGLVKRITWLQRLYQLGLGDAMLLKTTYTFGISEWELFWAPTTGATTVVAHAEGHKNSSYLAELTLNEGVTVCCYVPSALAALSEAVMAENRPSKVRLAISCGEALPASISSLFFEAFPRAVLNNVYGPTEADMTFFELRGPQLAAPPIGRPMDNVVVYLLDAQLRLVPAGAPGHLHFGSPHAARGYLNLPELTKKCWVENPFFESLEEADVPRCPLLYASGDLARWLPDGRNLAFCGRVDTGQIKLRGYRIELEDVASALRSHPGVSYAAASLVDPGSAKARLVGYVVGVVVQEGAECVILDSRELAVDALEHCKETLPSYMVPSTVLELSMLPLTARGKLDRPRLPAPPRSFAANDETFVECLTQTEKVIERVWQELLDYDDEDSVPISATSDFVLLGGNSLLAGRATTRLRLELGVGLAGTAMYLHPTIAELAAHIDALPKKQISESSKKIELVYKGHSATGLFTMMGQLFIFIACLGLKTLQGLPAMLLVYSERNEPLLYVACVLAPSAVLMTRFALAMLALAGQTVLAPRACGQVALRLPLWGRGYLCWLMSRHLFQLGYKAVEALFGGTPMLPLYLRFCGASVGTGVTLSAGVDFSDPTFLALGDDVQINGNSRLSANFVEDGEMVFARVTLGDGARMETKSSLGAGATLPPYTSLGCLVSAGAGAVIGGKDLVEVKKRDKKLDISLLQYFVGLPLIIACEAFSYACAITVLCLALDHAHIILALWLARLAECEAFFAATVVVKFFIVGTFQPGPRPKTHYDEFRRWLLERLVHNAAFCGATEPYVNTELLSWKFRLLGAKIGWRVNMDFFDCVEFDLIDVGDEVVFGSCVALVPSDEEEDLMIKLESSCNVLDHTVLLGGCVVERCAVTGTHTFGPKNHVFPATSISTGRVQGAPLQLKFQGDVEAGTSKLPKKDAERVLSALKKHRDPFVFWRFNCFCVVAAVVLEPVETLLELAPVACYAYGLQGAFAGFVLSQGFALATVVWLKWRLVGSYKECDAEYYGDMHHCWVFMMSLGSSIGPLTQSMQGTFLTPFYLKAMGASIGENCCIFYGAALEFDLLTLAAGASTAPGCDLTAHTVENMVVKFAQVKIGAGCALHAEAVVMPGGEMLTGSTLLSGSQVLKGETVGEGQVWGGLPAAQVGDRDAERAAFYASLTVKEDTKMIHEVAVTLGVGLGAATKLHKSMLRGEKAANNLYAAIRRVGSKHRKQLRPLPPFAKRPPHLRPRHLAQALQITVQEARSLLHGWRSLDEQAHDKIQSARLILLRDHAGLTSAEEARALSRAAKSGDPLAQQALKAYKTHRVVRLPPPGTVVAPTPTTSDEGDATATTQEPPAPSGRGRCKGAGGRGGKGGRGGHHRKSRRPSVSEGEDSSSSRFPAGIYHHREAASYREAAAEPLKPARRRRHFRRLLLTKTKHGDLQHDDNTSVAPVVLLNIFWRDVALVLAGALALSLAANIHFLL